MSDQGEKTCPLCAEDMDLTDQQLKPCKCGYEICVWCWHHIIEMAEKDETEGRCPACRTPYNKEKIVGMAANCGRLVAEMNTEKKVKSQKSKSKTSEGRKQLSSVRVIQRNLVYIVGLPLNLADEDVLQHKEYFGQYGKVMKVSISRTATGAIQHFTNNTCSVYITYAKEEEAVRCIQSVHGFVLEGRSLRACFGTTKYCHAWLRNVPCSNPDCLYLHEIGSHEDSFTKDEIISAYTRSRVQQITGATINMQRRSGNVLPPPSDEYCNNTAASSGKPICKTSTHNPSNIIRGSPPNSSSGRSVTLPAAASWGMRASNTQPQAVSLASSDGPSKHKPDACISLASSTIVASPAQVSIVDADVVKKPISSEESCRYVLKGESRSASAELHVGTDSQTAAYETPVKTGPPATTPVNGPLYNPPAHKEGGGFTNLSPKATNSLHPSEQASGPNVERDLSNATDGKIQTLCSDMLSLRFDKNQGSEECYNEQFSEPFTSLAAESGTASPHNTCLTLERPGLRLDFQNHPVKVANREVGEDFLSFDDQRLKDPELYHRSYLPYVSNSNHFSDHSTGYSSHHNEDCSSINVNMGRNNLDEKVEKGLLPASSIPVISNGYLDDLVGNSVALDNTTICSHLPLDDLKGKGVGRFGYETAGANQHAALDMGENSIISNILSMDSESWDESLASPQNLVKLLGENNKQQGTLRLSNSWKGQNNNQSRFSFAREGDSMNHLADVQHSLSNFGHGLKNGFSHESVSSKDYYLDKPSSFPFVNAEESDSFASSQITLNKLPVSRAQVSAPPGFSVPSRAPPPGFAAHERTEQAYNSLSGNHSLTLSARNPYQAQPSPNIGGASDIEFMDPAILAVGKGRVLGGLNSPSLDMRSNFHPQLNSSYENEARLQLLMQSSLSQHQNQRYSDIGESTFPSFRDAYGNSSRLMEQTMVNNLSPFSQLTLPQSRNALMSNGHWDGWNEVRRGNDLGVADLLRTERLGLDKYYGGYEESKFRMPSSGDLYNRTFGI